MDSDSSGAYAREHDGFLPPVLGAHAAYADGATNELVEAEASIKLPSIEAGAFYRSKKIERGMVENKESVFGYEVEVEWYGFFGGVESCHDMTNVERRRGRYNEIESFAGYGFSVGDFSAKAAYVYKKCGGDEHNTQEVEFELEYETPWVTPFLFVLRRVLYHNVAFHRDFMHGKVTIVGCPKLDPVDYSEKLTEIIRENDIKFVTIVRMEVPCCGGLELAAKKALRASGKFIQWQVVTISLDGRIIDS